MTSGVTAPCLLTLRTALSGGGDQPARIVLHTRTVRTVSCSGKAWLTTTHQQLFISPPIARCFSSSRLRCRRRRRGAFGVCCGHERMDDCGAGLKGRWTVNFGCCHAKDAGTTTRGWNEWRYGSIGRCCAFRDSLALAGEVQDQCSDRQIRRGREKRASYRTHPRQGPVQGSRL